MLLVDDEPLVLKMAERLLEARGFTVFATVDAASALALGARVSRLDLLVTDLTLPDIDGPTLAAALRETRPELPVLVMSGHDATHAGRGSSVVPGKNAFLAKPFTGREFDACLGALLGRGAAAAPRVEGDER